MRPAFGGRLQTRLAVAALSILTSPALADGPKDVPALGFKSVTLRPVAAKGADHEVRTITDGAGNVLSETTLVYGVENGLYRSYWATGNVRLEGMYEDGLKVGTWKHYEKTGEVLFETEFHVGTQSGVTLQYGDGSGPAKGTRVVVRRTAYAFGLRDGAYEELRNSGGTSVRGTFVAGRKEGTWTRYAHDGTELAPIQYVCDRKVGSESPNASRACPEPRITIPLPKLVKRPGDSDTDFKLRVARWQIKLKLLDGMCDRAKVEHVIVGGNKVRCSYNKTKFIRTPSGMAGGDGRG